MHGRTFALELGNSISSSQPVLSGVPQGSCLGSVLFSLNMLPLGLICHKHNVAYHCYADDTQLYLPLKCDEDSKPTSLLDCLEEVKVWISSNFLQLNECKSEVVIFSPSKVAEKLTVHLGPLATNVSKQVRDLGVIFDSELKFDRQINAVVKGSFYQLRGIAKLNRFFFFNFKDLEMVIHVFISSRLNYCNLLYLGLSKNLLARLQLVQKAAVRLA